MTAQPHSPTPFSPALLDELARLPGSRHCFLKQLADNDGAPMRAWLTRALEPLPQALADHTADLLRSLDNRRFFQGVATATAARILDDSDWTVVSPRWPGPILEARAPGGELVDVLPIGFVRQARPVADRQVIARLSRALDRVGSRSRIAVVVRRWLPHDFDPEPVRRAIDLWLREVDRGGWEGRYAAYDDDNISLEFALTGERATASSGVVAFALPPLDGLHAVEALQRTVVTELDRRRSSAPRQRGVLVVATSSLPWPAGPGSLREHLLGKPIAITAGGANGMEIHYGAEQSPSLFRDPFHRDLLGLVLAAPAAGAGGVPTDARAWLNPWCQGPLAPASLSMPVLTRAREEAGCEVLRWFPGPAPT